MTIYVLKIKIFDPNTAPDQKLPNSNFYEIRSAQSRIQNPVKHLR